MIATKKKPCSNELRLTVNDLKKKQSVRATFRLPQHVIELLSVIAGQLGIKQKSLFDQLVEDPFVLSQVAQEAQGYTLETKDRNQKTFVISRSSLLSLNEIAKKQKVSRDLLVEVSIKRLLPIVGAELETHRKRKELLIDMKRYLNHGQKLLEKTRDLLGPDDLLCKMLEKQVELAQKDIATVDAIVKKGKPMEAF